MAKVDPAQLGYDPLSAETFLVNKDNKSHQAPFGDIKASVLNSHIIHNETDPNLDYPSGHPDIESGTIWVDTSSSELFFWKVNDPATGSGEWVELKGGGGPDLPDVVCSKPVITGKPKVGETLRASTTFSGGTGAGYSGTWTWKRDGVFVSREASSSTLKLTDSDAGKQITACVVGQDSLGNFSVESCSDPTPTVEEADKDEDTTKPVADMLGLRFNNDRHTYLENGAKIFGNTFTFSAWVKPTYKTTGYLISGSEGSNGDGIYVSNAGTPHIGSQRSGSFTQHNFSVNTVPKHVWTHLVVTLEGTTVTLSVNGGAKETTTWSAFKDYSYSNIVVGNWSLQNTTTNNWDGYMSDVYYVEGQVLDPEVFGRDYGGKWGPRDSKWVIEDIKAGSLSPAESAFLMGETWSDGWANPTGDDWDAYVYQLNRAREGTKAFDGSHQSGDERYLRAAVPATGKTVTWTRNIPTNGEKVVIYYVNGNVADRTSHYIKINGTTLEDLGENDALNIMTVDVTDIVGSALTSIEISRSYAMLIGIAAVEIGGRILVDGIPNTSHRFMDYCDPSLGNGPGPLYDGSVSDAVYEYSTVPTTGAVIYDGPAISDSNGKQVRIWNNAGNAREIKINDSVVTFNNAADPNGMMWHEINSSSWSGDITKIEVKDTGAISSWGAIEVDGKILVDPGPGWDTSNIWSRYLTSDTPGGLVNSPSLAFDGDPKSEFYAKSGTATIFEPPQPILNVTSFVIRGGGYMNTTTDIGCEVTYTDGTTDNLALPSPTTGARDMDLVVAGYNTSKAGFKKLVFSYVTAGNYGFNMFTINGDVLVDTPSFGPSGFYLPFDPTNASELYTPSLSVTSGTISVGELSNAFDGDNSTWLLGSTVMEYGINPPIGQAGDEINIWGTYGSSAVTINGGTPVSGMPGGVVIAGPSDPITLTAPLSSVEVAGTDSSFGGVSLNGVRLLDHSSIGVDGSGAGNNFHDNNFGVGYAASRLWSQEVTSETGAFEANGLPRNLFNGKLTGPYCDADATGKTVTWTPVGGYTNTGDIEVYTTDRDRPFTLVYTDDSSNTGNTTQDSWTTIGTGKSVKSITIGGEAGHYNNWAAIRIDGNILMDASLEDTVIDNPMENYAVLDGTPGLSNGNLTRDAYAAGGATSWLSLKDVFDDSSNIYLELTIPPKNEGRDIFVGFCTSEAERLKYGSTTSFVVGGADGQVASGVDFELSDATTLVGIAYKGGEVILYQDSSQTFSKTISGTQYFGIDRMIGTGQRFLSVNFGQQPFAGTNVTDNGDGTVTIDGDVYNHLYQNWEDYMRSALGYAIDRIAELEASNYQKTLMINMLLDRIMQIEASVGHTYVASP